MQTIESIREAIPPAAVDIKLNLQAVLTQSSLSEEQTWGVAVASAIAARNPSLRDSLLTEARAKVSQPIIDDAVTAAALMGMNNIYYRFRHMTGKESYSSMPPRLRMNRLAKPASSKANLELFSLAVSAINGCEMCIKAHEHELMGQGLSEAQIHDAARIASVVHAAAVALECGEVAA